MERLANASSRDGRMAPFTTGKEDLGVVTPLVTAEKERDYFFCLDDSFFCACVAPLPVRGFWEFLHIFNNYS